MTSKMSTRLIATLAKMRNDLRGLAVLKRVGKEMRELRERLSDLSKQHDLVQQTWLSSMIAELEHQTPRCGRRHRLIIRTGDSG